MKYLSVIFLSFLCSNIYAALIDRGDGLIYDDEQDITWLQDINYAQTSNYTWNGRLTWFEAIDWASNLSYQGFSDWRLPSAGPNPQWTSGDTSSEMGYMYYENLNMPAGNSPLNSSFVDGITGDTVSFSGLTIEYYWTSDSASESTANVFRMYNGYTEQRAKYSKIFAWAVHDGDIGNVSNTTSVPVPASAFLFGSALLGLIVTRRQANP